MPNLTAADIGQIYTNTFQFDPEANQGSWVLTWVFPWEAVDEHGNRLIPDSDPIIQQSLAKLATWNAAQAAEQQALWLARVTASQISWIANAVAGGMSLDQATALWVQNNPTLAAALGLSQVAVAVDPVLQIAGVRWV